MLGVVLRELEGATPGLQDVPAHEVQEVSSVPEVRALLMTARIFEHPDRIATATFVYLKRISLHTGTHSRL